MSDNNAGQKGSISLWRMTVVNERLFFFSFREFHWCAHGAVENPCHMRLLWIVKKGWTVFAGARQQCNTAVLASCSSQMAVLVSRSSQMAVLVSCSSQIMDRRRSLEVNFDYCFLCFHTFVIIVKFYHGTSISLNYNFILGVYMITIVHIY